MGTPRVELERLQLTHRVTNLVSDPEVVRRRGLALEDIFTTTREALLKGTWSADYDPVVKAAFQTLYSLTWTEESAPGMIDPTTSVFQVTLPEHPRSALHLAYCSFSAVHLLHAQVMAVRWRLIPPHYPLPWEPQGGVGPIPPFPIIGSSDQHRPVKVVLPAAALTPPPRPDPDAPGIPLPVHDDAMAALRPTPPPIPPAAPAAVSIATKSSTTDARAAARASARGTTAVGVHMDVDTQSETAPLPGSSQPSSAEASVTASAANSPRADTEMASATVSEPTTRTSGAQDAAASFTVNRPAANGEPQMTVTYLQQMPRVNAAGQWVLRPGMSSSSTNVVYATDSASESASADASDLEPDIPLPRDEGGGEEDEEDRVDESERGDYYEDDDEPYNYYWGGPGNPPEDDVPEHGEVETLKRKRSLISPTPQQPAVTAARSTRQRDSPLRRRRKSTTVWVVPTLHLPHRLPRPDVSRHIAVCTAASG